jgi:hypothetical protein
MKTEKKQIIKKRLRFDDENLRKFSKSMEEIEWDNKPAEGTLSKEQIESIAKKIVKS